MYLMIGQFLKNVTNSTSPAQLYKSNIFYHIKEHLPDFKEMMTGLQVEGE
jgi:hypothetical protein